MSEPKRYQRCYHKDYIPEGMEEHYNGKWVKWEDYARLKAEVERLTEALNKFTNTPNGVHGVEVKVSFWSKSGCRLPSSFSTFWMNAEKGQP